MARVNQGAGRQRLIDSAVTLMRKQGYAGTAVNEIAQEGNAPMGSLYYHFPGGKEDLAATAMRAGAEDYAHLITRALDSKADFPTRVSRIAQLTADNLAKNDFTLGCPVAATALETVTTSSLLRQQSRDALDGWMALIQDAAITEGIAPAKAHDLAVAALSIIEGAELIARVNNSTEPMKVAVRTIHHLCATLTAQS